MIKFVNSMLEYVGNYIEKDFGIKPNFMEIEKKNKKNIKPYDITSMLYIDDEPKVLVAISFERQIIDEIFKGYTQEIEVEVDRIEEYIQATAGDIINLAVGRVLDEFGNNERSYLITTPITIDSAKSISCIKELFIYVGTINTKFGLLSIYGCST